MKIFGVSVAVITILGIGLFLSLRAVNSNEKLQAYSVRNNHTYAYTSELETFSVPFLINDQETIHTLEDAIVRTTITCEDSEMIVPVDLETLQFVEAVDFLNAPFYSYNFLFTIGVYAEDLIINIDRASLVVEYLSGEKLTLDIGSFHYTFEAFDSEHLSVHTRFNIHQHFDQYPNSVGLIFSLENKTASVIEIIDVNFNSNVAANMAYMRTFEGDMDAFLTLETVYGEAIDVQSEKSLQSSPIRLDSMMTCSYVVPFAYGDDLFAMHRYPIIIEYLFNGEKHRMVVDDFLFIRTKPFHVFHASIHAEVVFYAED